MVIACRTYSLAGSTPLNTHNDAQARCVIVTLRGVSRPARPLRPQAKRESSIDLVITMGCGDTCPVFPGIRYEDWKVTDPHGTGMDTVRQVRDDIEHRVRSLLDDLGITPVDA